MKIELKHDDIMDRWDLQTQFQLGDLKDMITVAYLEPKNNTITFLRPLKANDVQAVLNKCEELMHELEKNPLDEIDIEEEREVHFEPYPDE